MTDFDGLDPDKERAALLDVIRVHRQSIDEALAKMRREPALKDDPGQWAYCAALETMLHRCERRLVDLDAMETA